MPEHAPGQCAKASQRPNINEICMARRRPNGTVPSVIDDRKLSRLSANPRTSNATIMSAPMAIGPDVVGDEDKIS